MKISELNLKKDGIIVKSLTPFRTLTKKEQYGWSFILAFSLMLFWYQSGSAYIPAIHEILLAIPRLITLKNLIPEFLQTFIFCIKAFMFSILIGITIAYLSIIPMFRITCEFLRKFRFLPSAGLTFLFLKINPSATSQMMMMMCFTISAFMIDSFVQIALSIASDNINYCKSLRLSRWEMVRELLIYEKAPEFFIAAIQNFSIAWMMISTVENLFRSNGGLGVVLAGASKYFHYDEIYAIQLIILFTGIIADLILRRIRVFFFPYVKLKIIK